MINDIDIAAKIAEYLLQIKAVELRPGQPFTWSSGWNSPIYCDNRKTLSYPKIRTFIRHSFAELIESKYGTPDMIAGVATGGIAIGALVAQELGLPFVYVRSSSKGHGLKNRIEGAYEGDEKVVVIEDLISTGGSSLSAVEALREEGMEVKGVTAIFNYGFDAAAKAFEEAKCKLDTLCNYEIMIDVALKLGTISEKDLSSLREWRVRPSEWGK